MSTPAEHNFDPDLLDLHLGHLSDSQRSDLLQRVAGDPKLAAEHEAFAAVFRALSLERDVTAPAGLAERVAARVAQRSQPPRERQSAKRDREDDEVAGGRWVIGVRSLRDIIAVAAVIVLAVGIGLPGLLNVRDRNQRIACQANLSRIGQGLNAYASSFGDSLPFAGWNKNSYSWKPTSDPGVESVPNRRHMFPLLRGGHVKNVWLICPSRRDVPMPEDQVKQRQDFIESRNVSYAYQNMAGVRPSLRSDPNLPILADDNPLFDDGLPLFGIGQRLGLTDAADSNSRAHRGKGQSILTLGGSVKFADTPYAGVNGDNIWLLQGVQDYEGKEGPQTASDSHLLK
jgi:hypothetical protein